MAKNYSYQASVYYINRDFDKASEFYQKSLEIRKKLGNIDKNYITVLKLFILSKYRTGDFCSISLSENDRMLLIGDNDLDFLYEFNMIKSSCF
jgi:tetratricopeptide (TPR) repeat protein